MQINPLISPDTIRRKIRSERRSAMRSMKACADLLKIPLDRYAAYESGAISPSLPEIEILSLFFHIPASKLLTFDENTLPLHPVPPQEKDFSTIITLRHKIIGASIRHLREEQGLTQSQLAESIGLSESELDAFELGKSPLSLTHLYPILQVLGLNYNSFIGTPSTAGSSILLDKLKVSLPGKPPSDFMEHSHLETQPQIQSKDSDEDEFTSIQLD